MPLWGLEAIWRDDQVVGFLRRADYAFTLNKSIGYGYIRRPDGLPVTTDFLLSGHYSIESMDGKHKAHGTSRRRSTRKTFELADSTEFFFHSLVFLADFKR